MTYIGTGVTITKRGGAEVYTVIKETKSKKTLTIQRDKAIVVQKPQYEVALKSKALLPVRQKDVKYEYQRDCNGKMYRIRLLKDGNWKLENENMSEFDVKLNVRQELNYLDL